MKNILISMTDFVLEQEKTLENLLTERLPSFKVALSYGKNCQYARFLKRKLTKNMFYSDNPDDVIFENIKVDQYFRVYLGGYVGEIQGDKLITNLKTIEDLVGRNIEIKDGTWLDIFDRK